MASGEVDSASAQIFADELSETQSRAWKRLLAVWARIWAAQSESW